MSRVIVVGDVMLDVFSEGSVERISPEAPVAVLHNPVSHEVVGGAANSAVNIRTLGQPVGLLGLVGNDRSGMSIRAQLASAGVDDLLFRFETWPTIVKQRFLASGQQVLRVDHEESLLPRDVDGAILGRLSAALEGALAVVLSDYDKGCITDDMARACVAEARRLGVPCIVDSKRLDPSVFSGCTVLAPNMLEARRMTGISDPSRAAARIAESTHSSVIVTLGSDGMLVHDEDGRQTHIKSQAQEVIDVTGAGDTVTAALAVSLTRGESLVDAAVLATRAAAVAVAHTGTHAVTLEEVDQRSDIEVRPS